MTCSCFYFILTLLSLWQPFLDVDGNGKVKRHNFNFWLSSSIVIKSPFISNVELFRQSSFFFVFDYSFHHQQSSLSTFSTSPIGWRSFLIGFLLLLPICSKSTRFSDSSSHKESSKTFQKRDLRSRFLRRSSVSNLSSLWNRKHRFA